MLILYENQSVHSYRIVGMSLFTHNNTIFLVYIRPAKIIRMISNNHGSKTAIAYKEQLISYDELHQKIFGFATLLENKEIDKVAIISENRPEWIMAFFAAWYHDITVVPIDFMASVDDVAHILNDCKPEFVFHSENTAETLQKASAKVNQHPDTYQFGSSTLPQVEGKWTEPADREKTAVIIYTSGTTGDPKGVMLSYTNLFNNIKAVSEDVPIYDENVVVLLILPLQHIFPLVGSMLIPLSLGGTIATCPSLQAADIIETMQKHKVTHIIGVPRLYESIYKGVMTKINASPVTKGLYHFVKAIKSPALGRTIFKKVHQQFGGHLNTLVSGGAALPPEVGSFYDALGFEVLEGFGMTESAPMITFTRPGDVVIGSVGLPLPVLEVQIRDGEVVAKGASIMKGYYNRPEETAETVRDGWLYTGDLGRFDSKGRLYITGRKKEIIVLSNGKNINPNEIEESIMNKAEDTIAEIGVALHDGILHAVILPDFKALSKKNIGDVTAYFNNLFMTEYNPHVTPYKQVNKFTIVKEGLPRTRLSKLQRFRLPEIIENGTQKSKRAPEPKSKEFKSIKKYLEELISRDVYADSHMVFDLALDSLAKLELIDYIERTFGIEIKEDELLNYNTVGELVQFISSHKQHFKEEEFDWHEMMTKPLDLNLQKPWFTLHLIKANAAFFTKLLFKTTIRGNTKLPAGGAIIAPNHSSFLDAFLVFSLLKKDVLNDTYFYAKKDHIDTPFRRMMAKHNNVIIMDLEKDLYRSIQQLAQLLREGKKLMIFPEGTRSATGELGEFKKTFAILSKELNVPVYPVAIKGAFEAWPRHKKLPISGSSLTVSFLPPVYPAKMDEIQIADKVKEAIKAEL